MPPIKSIAALFQIALIDPRLMLLAVNVKRSKKTYLTYSTLLSLARNYIEINHHSSQPVHVAEFGVGLGGSAMILAWMVSKHRGTLTLFDVFGRIPAPTESDGEQALHRYEDILGHEKADYYGNLDNVLELVLHDLHQVCPSDRIETVQGKYEEILPGLTDHRLFDLVHIDCDWYESSRAVYHYLQSCLNPGAIIQVDDYSQWEGSKRAYQDATWLHAYQTHLVDGALVIDTAKRIPG